MRPHSSASAHPLTLWLEPVTQLRVGPRSLIAAPKCGKCCTRRSYGRLCVQAFSRSQEGTSSRQHGKCCTRRSYGRLCVQAFSRSQEGTSSRQHYLMATCSGTPSFRMQATGLEQASSIGAALIMATVLLQVRPGLLQRFTRHLTRVTSGYRCKMHSQVQEAQSASVFAQLA